MQIDLQQLKTSIEKELEELERRKSALQGQIAHIEAVERMASGAPEPGELDGRAADSDGSESGGSSQGTGRSWFRR